MRNLFLAVFTLLYFSAYSQEPKLIQQYTSDSTLMGTGVVSAGRREGLWKFYNPKTNTQIADLRRDKKTEPGLSFILMGNERKSSSIGRESYLVLLNTSTVKGHSKPK
jgi:hypothetical protein